MSELRTNRIVPRDGLPSGSSGGVIQVVHVNTSSHTYSTRTSYTDITGVTATITPTRSDSKILIQCTLSIGKENNHSFLGRIVRNGSVITGSGGVAESGHGNQIDGAWWNVRNNIYCANACAVSYLDSPSSTSAVTYKAQGKTTSASYPFAINRTVSSNDNEYATPAFSMITLMEISG